MEDRPPAALCRRWIDTPLGSVRVEASPRGLLSIWLGAAPQTAPRDGGAASSDADSIVDHAQRELLAYFEGAAGAFSAPLDPAGTPFQHEVWAALRQIPAGQTRSYLDIARAIGRPAAFRAVARANATNPIAILIPCHRVIGSDGSLTGYAGGLERKQWLLDHERRSWPHGAPPKSCLQPGLWAAGANAS